MNIPIPDKVGVLGISREFLKTPPGHSGSLSVAFHGVQPRPQTCRERSLGPRGRLRKPTVGYGRLRKHNSPASSFYAVRLIPSSNSCLFRISSRVAGGFRISTLRFSCLSQVRERRGLG